MLAFISMFLFLSACSSIGPGIEVFTVSDLGKDGLPKFSENGSQKDITFVSSDDERYVIQPGDKLSIKFFFNPELNEENLIVRPDGLISLQLVNEIKAADLTPVQLKSLLAEKYAGQLKNPEIAVIVRSVREPFRIYVDGQVKSPGEFEIVGSLSVLQAIARAGGMLEDTAQKSEVKVIRKGHDGQKFVIKVDLNRALNEGELSQNIRLLPSDFVYVPRSFW